MRMSVLIVAVAALVLSGAAPAGAATPAQQAAAAAKARADAAARARFDAAAKARANAQMAARARADAGVAAQKRAAVELFLRSQAAARTKAEARPAYVIANVPRQKIATPQVHAATIPAAPKPPIYHRSAAGTGQPAPHAAAGRGHSR